MPRSPPPGCSLPPCLSSLPITAEPLPRGPDLCPRGRSAGVTLPVCRIPRQGPSCGPEGWRRTRKQARGHQGQPAEGGAPWPFVSEGQGGIPSTGSPCVSRERAYYGATQNTGPSPPHRPFISMEIREDGRRGRGAGDGESRKGREKARQVETGEGSRGGSGRWQEEEGTRPEGRALPHPPSERLVGSLSLILLSSLPPRTLPAGSHTPWGLPGPRRARPLPCSWPSDL